MPALTDPMIQELILCFLQLVVAGLVIVVGHASSTASAAVKLAGDGVGDVAELLLLLVKVLGGSLSGVVVEPVLGLLDSIENLFTMSVSCSLNEDGSCQLTVSLSSSSILPPRPSSSLTWFFKEKA
jgi:hypothetical protein